MSQKWPVLLCALFAVALCDECSPDAKKLTSLVSNITNHVNEAMRGDQDNYHTFHDNAVTSRNALQEKIGRTQTQLDSHRQSLSRLTVQLTETRALIAHLELEKTEVQIANDNTLLECERSEKMFQSRERENESRLKFLDLIQSFLISIASSGGGDQDIVTNLMQALPVLTATTLEHSKHLEKMRDVQVLLQQSVDATGTPAEETVQQLMDLLHDLRVEAEAAAAADRQRAQVRSDECSSQMNALRDKRDRTQKKIQDANEKSQRYSTQIEDESNTVGVLASDVAILTHSLTSKQQIIAEMDQAHQMRTQIRSSQLSRLTSLLSSPACCMCPSSEHTR